MMAIDTGFVNGGDSVCQKMYVHVYTNTHTYTFTHTYEYLESEELTDNKVEVTITQYQKFTSTNPLSCKM